MGTGQTILFQDTFDRPDNRNIDAELTGITNNTETAFEPDTVYVQPWLDPNSRPPTYAEPDADPANGGGSRIQSNVFHLKYGVGTANAFIDHHFVDEAILQAGGFSVSVDVTGYNQTTINQGAAFGVGISDSDAFAMRDAVGNSANQIHMSGALGVGLPGQTNAVASFWFGILGNSTVVWGSRDTVLGSASVPSKTGTISANFSVTDFDQGSEVFFEVFHQGLPVGSGTFVWSNWSSNIIALDGRDNTFVGVDNLTVSTYTPSARTTLAVSPSFVDSDQAAQPVNLTWTADHVPAGSTFEITADKAVTFPSGNTGPATTGSGTIPAVVNGTLGDTTFTISLKNAASSVIKTSTVVVKQTVPASTRPNVIVMLVDDLGWSDLGSYGGEIPTPNLDALATNGTRFRQFYNSARCSPTRLSLVTGLYPQQAAVDPGAPLPDLRTDNNVTFAELLASDGYRTYMAGKWHLGNGVRLPENRGFQHVWRMGDGQANNTTQWVQSAYTLVSQNNEIPLRDYGPTPGSFYQTDAIGDYAVDFINHNIQKNDGSPFAMYLAFGAPHFPIQAPAALADTFMSTYSQGWEVIRRQRYDRQLATGVIDSRYPYPGLGGTGPHQAEPIVAIPEWESLDAARRADLTRRMALYAAMIQKVDDNVGKIVAHLRETGKLDNTMIVFLSDNGANHERGVFGTNTDGPLTGEALTLMGQPGRGDGIHYGGGWAHLSNTPLKLFKHFTHEGGIRAPLIFHWPAGTTARNTWVEEPGHLVDIVSTITAATQAPYPTTFAGHPVLPLEGRNLLPAIEGQPVEERSLFVEHESNRMVRKGKWKLVTEAFTAFDNEFRSHQKLLYDMDADPGETVNLAAQYPAKVVELVDEWNAWSTRVGLPAGRLIPESPISIIPGTTPQDLFVDTFNRPDNVDIDASSEGISGSLVPPLGTGVTWFEGYEGSGNTSSIQIIDNYLQMATGVGMSENGLNYNFIDQDILNAGGFSVSVRVLNILSDLDDVANRYVGFGVGLNATQASRGNDIGLANPPPIRGNAVVPGAAAFFIELDLAGNVKIWSQGAVRATIPVGKTRGTLTAAFKTDSFTAGSTVRVSAYFDGQLLDLDPSGPSTEASFTWNETGANYIALSARAITHAHLDNFAVRKLPLADSLAVEYAIGSGLTGTHSDSTANPDGDGLDNFGEWAFGTNPAQPDDHVAATSILLSEPVSGVFRFAHRRLSSRSQTGLEYVYRISSDLSTWRDATVVEEESSPLASSPGYEVVTLRIDPEELQGHDKLFLKVGAER